MIVTADDFGLHPRVNAAVERAHRDGVLAAASLMVAAPAARDAVERARRLPSLAVGLHLVLADGAAMLPPGEIAALVGPDGRFGSAMARDGCRFFFLPWVRAQLRREIRAQFEAFAATGLALDHVNAHKHFHLHPTVLAMIVEIGRDYGLRAVRLPFERSAPSWLRPWIALVRARLDRAGLAHNDYVVGIARTGRMDERVLLDAIAAMPAHGVGELYCHPAEADAERGDAPVTASMHGYRPAAELDALLHARVSALFARMWLHLGTALFLLCAILSMVYLVAQQISRPLRELARVMDIVRRTGDHRQRATWHSQDEIGQLVTGFNEMLVQLDHERDVQKELAATARASEAQYALVEATPVPMMVTAVPGHEVLHANRPALYWLNGRTSDPWAYGLDSAVRARFFQQLSDREAIDEFEVRWMASEEPTWAMLSARRLTFQGRDAVLTAFTPINQIKLMEQRLELWAKVFEASSEAILILDSDRRLLTANASFYRATGYRAEKVTGTLPDFIVANGGDTPLLAKLTALVDISSVWNGEAVVRRRAGGDYPAWLMISAVRDKRGGVSHYICTLIDITDRKKSEARIQFLAEHDVLTELPNRALFTRRLGAAIEHAQPARGGVAVMFIDLDRFKDINDTFGHHAGDGLLRSVSRRLMQSVRGGDTVSRLGGDEFTVLLTGAGSAADVQRLIDERLLPLMREPHSIGGMTLQVACSIGIAMYPDDGEDIETLMQNADAAMYRAKSSGRNLVKFFSREMAESTRHRLELETHLGQAVENGELWLAYQPCVQAGTGELLSVEALLRWQHPHLGTVPPGKFIPIAEETRLIVPIGAWVIDEVCRQIASWRAAGLPELRVSLNLSVVQLRDDPQLVNRLSGSLARHAVDPASLELEITETVLMESVDRYLDVVRAIREIGVKLSLDDFGTGYSSLSYLHRFPLDRLKIDRAFVNGRLDALADIAVIRAIVELGHELGLRVVAEGVEQAEEASALKRIGCDELQGFLYAQPLRPEGLAPWMQARDTACLDEAV
nr:hopanoid biosynthesis-associated protein HpnK [Burkholderia sp. Ac-20379]